MSNGNPDYANEVKPLYKLDPGKNYNNIAEIYTQDNQKLIAGELYATYVGKTDGGFTFKLLQDIPNINLKIGETIILTPQTSNKDFFHENTNIIDINNEGNVGTTVTNILKTGINGASKRLNDAYNNNAVIGGGKASKRKSKSKTRKLKRRVTRKSKTRKSKRRQRQRHVKKSKSNSKSNTKSKK